MHILVRGVSGRALAFQAGPAGFPSPRALAVQLKLILGALLGLIVAGGTNGARRAVAGIIWVISGRYPTRGYPGNGGQGFSRSTSAERACVRRRKVCPEAIAVSLLIHR